MTTKRVNYMWRVLVVLVFTAILPQFCHAEDLNRMTSLEERRLERARKTGMDQCKGKGSSNKAWMKCTAGVKRTIENKLARLHQDPELYFYEKEARDDRGAVRREVRRELNARGY